MGRPKRSQAVHVVTTSRRVGEKRYETHLLRRSYRENGKVKKETVGNLSYLPISIINAIRAMLTGKELIEPHMLEAQEALPHGHVQAVLLMIGRLKLGDVITCDNSRQRSTVLALIAQQILTPGVAGCGHLLQHSTLAQELDVEHVSDREVWAALTWLGEHAGAVDSYIASVSLPACSRARYGLCRSGESTLSTREDWVDTAAPGELDSLRILANLAAFVDMHLREAWREVLDDAGDGTMSFDRLLGELGCCMRISWHCSTTGGRFTSVTALRPRQLRALELAGGKVLRTPRAIN